MIRRVLQRLTLIKKKREFKRKNIHNQTWLIRGGNLACITIGKMTWGGIHVIDYMPEDDKECQIKIGSYCSIAGDVKFMRGGEHRTDRISTFLYKSCYSLGAEDNLKNSKDIVVEDDVWIGYGAMILPGANIGQGAIIGAGSIVRGTVPPYTVYVGDRVVRQRFPEELIKELTKLDYSKLTEDMIKENLRYFYSEVDKKTVSELLKCGMERTT